MQYLDEVAATSTKPFFLIVSLVNPHDVLNYPSNFNVTYQNSTWLEGDIKLPLTVGENISYPYKPSVQEQINKIMDNGLGPLNTTEMKLNYLNFYGNLMKYADQYMVQLLDKLDSINKTMDTIVIRTSDHGEMGLAHGGLRQKNFVFYEEAAKIPLVYSNPVLFPEPISTDALVGQVDFVPTIASLFSAPESAKQKTWVGRDYSKVLFDPSTPATSVQDYVAFMYGDIQSGQSHGPYPQPPNQLVAIREMRYKFVKYFDPNEPFTGIKPQYEMYDLKTDPYEATKLNFPSSTGKFSTFSKGDTATRRQLFRCSSCSMFLNFVIINFIAENRRSFSTKPNGTEDNTRWVRRAYSEIPSSGKGRPPKASTFTQPARL